MCYYPEIVKIIQYSNGASISISGIEPFSFKTREIENKDIHVIISLMEELSKPHFLIDSIEPNIYPWIYHHYYNIKNEPHENVEKFFDPISKKIIQFLDRKMNVLIHCRTGISTSITFLIAFFIRASVYSPQYIVYDMAFYIPKSYMRWTDSFLEFIRYYHPCANPIREYMSKLYVYENNLFYDIYGYHCR